MTSKAKVAPIPNGCRTVTPDLLVRDASAFIEFAKRALAAEVAHRSEGPNGAVMSSELKIGDSMLMCADPLPGQPNSGVKDPFGNQWWFATHIEFVSDEETARRAAAQHK
jgi:uncharacterized glyoxalase superfamily protein PhnB